MNEVISFNFATVDISKPQIVYVNYKGLTIYSTEQIDDIFNHLDAIYSKQREPFVLIENFNNIVALKREYREHISLKCRSMEAEYVGRCIKIVHINNKTLSQVMLRLIDLFSKPKLIQRVVCKNLDKAYEVAMQSLEGERIAS